MRADVGVGITAEGLVRICRGSVVIDVPRDEAAAHVQAAVVLARSAKRGGTVLLRDPAGEIREY